MAHGITKEFFFTYSFVGLYYTDGNEPSAAHRSAHSVRRAFFFRTTSAHTIRSCNVTHKRCPNVNVGVARDAATSHS